jgi:hypothetical protein
MHLREPIPNELGQMAYGKGERGRQGVVRRVQIAYTDRAIPVVQKGPTRNRPKGRPSAPRVARSGARAGARRRDGAADGPEPRDFSAADDLAEIP